MAEVQWVAGVTKPRTFQITVDGSPLNLTGATPTLVLTKRDGTVVTTTGDVSIMDAATGLVRYSPDPEDLVAADSPLIARFLITDSSGFTEYAPSGAGDVWRIFAVGV